MSNIELFQPRGQCIILLLAALKDAGTSLSRRQSIDHISENHWFALQCEDWKPYPSQGASGEARWKTLIAWARKDAVIRGLINDFERDAWSLSKKGHSIWDILSTGFSLGNFDVSQGYLWSKVFKQKLNSAYSPSSKDALRPATIYRELDLSVLDRLVGYHVA